MTLLGLGAIFMVGLLGGVHCAGMCGGIVTALSAPSNRIVLNRRPGWLLHAGYHAGRIASYMGAGALAGSLGSMALFFNHLLPVQVVMYAAANLMLIGLGLYLMGHGRFIVWMERVGGGLWQRIRPLAGGLLPADTLPRALALGALWGWIPCGLVYSMLATALLAGDAASGATVMLAFGLGTLPNLVFAGALMRLLARRRQGAWLRRGFGAIVTVLGVAGIAHAAVAGPGALSAILCYAPP